MVKNVHFQAILTKTSFCPNNQHTWTKEVPNSIKNCFQEILCSYVFCAGENTDIGQNCPKMDIFYHTRNWIKSKRNDLRSKLPKSFPYKHDSVCLGKVLCKFQNKLSLPSPFICTKVFPIQLIRFCKKHFWAFLILNHFALVLISFWYGIWQAFGTLGDFFPSGPKWKNS